MNTVRTIHFADLRDALAYRVSVFVLGLLVAALSITGANIWLRKRQARRFVSESLHSASPG